MKHAAVDPRLGRMALIPIVSVVHMPARRVASRGSMHAVIAIVRTMTDPGRPRNLERQDGQQEPQNKIFHGGGV